jgi:hypothetical protein
MYNAIKYKFSPTVQHEIQANLVKFCYKFPDNIIHEIFSARAALLHSIKHMQQNQYVLEHFFAKCAQTATYTEICTMNLSNSLRVVFVQQLVILVKIT